MIKSIFFSFGVFLFSSFSYAEYLGIEEVPVGDHDIQKVLNSAIETRDFSLISNWKDKFETPYVENKFCAFTQRAYNSFQIDLKSINADISSYAFANLMSDRYAAIVPADCKDVYVWKLYRILPRSDYSPDIFDLVNSTKKSKDIKLFDNYAEQRKTVVDIINKIPNEKYQIFIPMIISNSADYQIRNLAMKKFLDGYSKSNETDFQSIKNLKEKMKKANEDGANKNWQLGFNDKSYFSVVDPKLLILSELNFELFDKLKQYSTRYSDLKTNLPVFDKHIIKKGGYTDQEIQNLGLSNLGQDDLNKFNNTNQTLRLFKIALDSYLEDHDLNYQVDNGNTLFMDIFSDRVYYSLPRNVFAPSLVRFWLEIGANPLLENKDNKTAYSLYLDKYGSGSEAINIKDAFVQKKYEFTGQ